jgi:hypothetical protein
MRKTNQILLIIVSGLLLCCKEKQSNNPITIITKADTVFTIQPESVFIGSKISIKANFNDSLYPVHNIVVSDSCIVFQDSFRYPLSYFTIPFLSQSGALQPLVKLERYTSPQIHLLEQYSVTQMNIGWYNLPTPIPIKDTCHYNWDKSVELWQCETKDDTIILNMEYGPYPIGGEFRELVLIDQGSNQLPKFVRYIKSRVDDTSSWIVDTVSTGFIKIQNWNTNGYIFGQVFYNVYFPGIQYTQEGVYFTFYYKFH